MKKVKSYPVIICILFLACNTVKTISSVKSGNYNIKIKSIATNCCGFCGEQVVLTKKHGEQWVLQFGCSFVDQCCAACGYPNRKWYYGRNHATAYSYLLVYDTAALLTRYPELAKTGFAAGSINNNIESSQVYPLSAEDSLLINTAIVSDTTHHCKDIEYLRYITGFVKEKKLAILPGK